MSVEISALVPATAQATGAQFSVKSIDVDALGSGRARPVLLLDDFRVSGRPFGPHPHAGFSAVTYVFEDSPGGLRSRDSLGDDVITAPGGIVWTQAGRGLVHEETPSEVGRELHGMQIFVDLRSANKHIPPRMLRLDSSEIPEWRSAAGDRVRVLAGSYESEASPLRPAEPFTLLYATLRGEIAVPLQRGHNTVVYVRQGTLHVRSAGRWLEVPPEHAFALRGDDVVTALAGDEAQALILSGAAA